VCIPQTFRSGVPDSEKLLTTVRFSPPHLLTAEAGYSAKVSVRLLDAAQRASRMVACPRPEELTDVRALVQPRCKGFCAQVLQAGSRSSCEPLRARRSPWPRSVYRTSSTQRAHLSARSRKSISLRPN
jgi:hypothetical protein